MIAHFPRRDSAKDAVIIADLSGVIVERELSLVAVCAVCEEIWQNATAENPWLPPSGQILNDIKLKSDSYAKQYERLANPKPALPPPPPKEEAPPPYGGRKWPEFTEEDKAQFWAELKPMLSGLKGIFRRLYEVPDEVEEPKEKETAEEKA